jgi:hypothetical protein
MQSLASAAPQLFHKDVYLPNIVRQDCDLRINYTGHARSEAAKEKYGNLVLPATLNPAKGELIEAEITARRVTKMVLRYAYSPTLDICFVLRNETCVTVWANRTTDKHSTLNLGKYARKVA